MTPLRPWLQIEQQMFQESPTIFQALMPFRRNYPLNFIIQVFYFQHFAKNFLNCSITFYKFNSFNKLIASKDFIPIVPIGRTKLFNL